ncbi:hypothetical protein ACO0KY_13855 [Undibacterium sp. Dicai25W]|uniref:hypothetical protein n=1 Tax=Undibacterium sp. Dicai25W TaxID=3413034 RepID=UPI003BF0F4F3
MYTQLRGPERFFRFGQWAIALLFAFFLINVGASLIADLPLLSKSPTPEDFVDHAANQKIELLIAPQRKQILAFENQQRLLTNQLNTSRENYAKDKQSFDNWRAARNSTEQSDQNPEVVAKARKLDVQLQMQQQLEDKIKQIDQQKLVIEENIRPQQQQLADLEVIANRAYETALYKDSLKAFGIRLLFVAPLLAIAIWLFRQHRKSQQWPFVWGYIVFALFAFFFELVPYLPSFGGYIRYGVGAALTFIGGKALIKSLQNYLEKKSLEQAAPQEERKHEIRYEKALESMARGQCPGCDRAIPAIEGVQVNFCMHCGLTTYTKCHACGLRHNAFYPYCPTCGVPANDQKNKKTS